MGKCVVKECSSRSQSHNKASGVTFHIIPKDPDRQEKWIKNIRLLRKETDWLPTKSTIICSHHFKEDDKIFPTSDKGRVYLTDDAVPVYEDYNYERYSPIDTNKANLCENIETDDEIEELTESLKLQNMRTKIERLQTVSRRRLKKIKCLEQRIRRLTARNKYLKDVIMEMRKNIYNVKMKPKKRRCIRNSKSSSTEVKREYKEEECE
ncbi:THAP domain-containing protein 5-like [Melitaea cinxia]|uniref:THAP domain-containing protein 5-like n=1 Tax=Melitaea cinxia TaxID=113334 RepID=UPI001E271244|nr:THAP domain-containing protein 5-like [Melitaea cinxia]